MEANELEKPYSKWEWFLYIILLPSLFTLILVGIILTFMKVDVITPILEVGNKIPFVEKIIPDPKGKVDDFVLYENTFNSQGNKVNAVNTDATAIGDEVTRYQEEIKTKEMMISQLEAELKEADKHIAQIEAELDSLKKANEDSTLAETTAKTKEVARLYSEMTASKAAPILSQLENQEAAQILAEMDNKKRAQIIAKMDPQKAAQLTLVLKESSVE